MSSSSSSSSSASTAPSRGAGYGERRNCPLVALSKSQDARLGRYDPLAHQAAPDRVECFVDGPYRGTQQSSTTVVQSGGRWCEVEVTVRVIVSEEVRLHDRGADKALAERASTACKEAIAGSDFAQGLLQDELVGGFFEPREHLRRDPPPSSRDGRRRHERSPSSRSRSPRRRSRSRSRSRHHHRSPGRRVSGFGETTIPKDGKLTKAQKKFLQNQKREEAWRLKQREAAKENKPAGSSEVFERPPLFEQQKRAEATKSLTPKTLSPKSAQQALTIHHPIITKAVVPMLGTLPPPPDIKIPPPPPRSMGTEALNKWWELVCAIHRDIPERDKPSCSYEEATRNTGLRFTKAAMVYSFLREFPEEDPVEEITDPFFQLDSDVPANGESPEQISGSSSSDTLDAYPK